VIFFGLPGEGFQFGIWICPCVSKNRLTWITLCHCAEKQGSLAKDWGEEKKERCYDARHRMAAKVVLRMDPPGESFASGRKCAAMTAWKDHGKQGVLRETPRAQRPR